MSHNAKKIVIITEKIIAPKVAQTIEKFGATGYTITAAGGKGSRGVRNQGNSSIFDTFTNVKIEVIVNDLDKAENIMNEVAQNYFENYAGITYIENVDILRPQKF